jgi:hypothetical protein
MTGGGCARLSAPGVVVEEYCAGSLFLLSAAKPAY